jgi:putative heme degradation protein
MESLTNSSELHISETHIGTVFINRKPTSKLRVV